MDRLVWLCLVTLRRLTGTQKREEGLVEAECHELCHRKHRVLHNESAIQWVVSILMSMAGKMQNGRFRELPEDSVCCRHHSLLVLETSEVAEKVNGNMGRNGHSDRLDFRSHKMQPSPLEGLRDCG